MRIFLYGIKKYFVSLNTFLSQPLKNLMFFLWKLTVLENFLVFSQRSFMSEAILKYVFEYLHFAQNKYLNTFRILCSKLYVLKSFSQFRTLIRLFRLQTTTLAGWNQQIMSQNLLVNFLSMKYKSIEDVMTNFY